MLCHAPLNSSPLTRPASAAAYSLPRLRLRLAGEQRGMEHPDIAVVQPRAVAPDAALRVQRHVAIAVVFGVGSEHEVGCGVLRVGGDPPGDGLQAGVVEGGVDVAAHDDERVVAEQR